MENKDNSKICIMIIPHTKRVRRITISKWIPKAVVTSVAVIIVTVAISFNNISSSKSNLKEEYDNSLVEISNLKREYEDKEKELEEKEKELENLKSRNSELHEITYEVENKLVEIDKLQRQLEKMAGIKSPSRGGNVGREIRPEQLETKKGLEVLKETLDDKERELEVFIDELEKRFEYLERIPDLWPSAGRLTSGFGNRKDPFRRGIRFHQGIDIANSSGTNIKAAGKGVVTFAGNRSGYGKVVIIDHGNEYSTLYGHNQKLLVNVGDRVEKGQVIAKMGSTGRSTGPHLHFEIHKNGNPINPLDILK